MSKLDPHTTSAWHSKSQIDVLEELVSSANGLTQPEAEQRLKQNGLNLLEEGKTRSPLKRFLAQCHNVLIYVLMVAAGITAFLGHWLDSGVIFGVVIINAIIGFVQEGKAEDALRAIKKMLSSQALVLRDGRRITIKSESLVVGDIIFLQSGIKSLLIAGY